jgi:hypothetical protein
MENIFVRFSSAGNTNLNYEIGISWEKCLHFRCKLNAAIQKTNTALGINVMHFKVRKTNPKQKSVGKQEKYDGEKTNKQTNKQTNKTTTTKIQIYIILRKD